MSDEPRAHGAQPAEEPAQKPAQANAPHAEAEAAAGGTPGARAEEPPQGRSGWPELDDYVAQLHAEHEAWRERMGALQRQLAYLRPATLTIAAQFAALSVEEDLLRISEAVLGGMGRIESVWSEFGFQRLVTLVWPAPSDPRPPLAARHTGGLYCVDVLFSVGEDQRGRVRVQGEKRLEAPLPTTRERLRRVLLAAVQAPRHIAESEAQPAEEEAGEFRPVADGQPAPSHEHESHRHAPRAEPRAGDPDQQPPPEEQVIPLGPAGQT